MNSDIERKKPSLARATWSMVPQVIEETKNDEGHWYVIAILAPLGAILLGVIAFIALDRVEGPKLALIMAIPIIFIVFGAALGGKAFLKALPLSQAITNSTLEWAEVLKVNKLSGNSVQATASIDGREVSFRAKLSIEMYQRIAPGVGVMLLMHSNDVISCIGLAPEHWSVGSHEQERKEAILFLRERVADGDLDFSQYKVDLGRILQSDSVEEMRLVSRGSQNIKNRRSM